MARAWRSAALNFAVAGGGRTLASVPCAISSSSGQDGPVATYGFVLVRAVGDKSDQFDHSMACRLPAESLREGESPASENFLRLHPAIKSSLIGALCQIVYFE